MISKHHSTWSVALHAFLAVAAAASFGCAPTARSSGSKSNVPPPPPQSAGQASSQGAPQTSGPAASKIDTALDSLQFLGMVEVRVESIRTMFEENFAVPVKFAPGIDLNARMNVKYDAKRKLRDTLRLGLDPLKLEYVVEGDGILVRPKAAS